MTSETEAEALLAVLERNRRTFAWKTEGLDETGLRAVIAASTMTLGRVGEGAPPDFAF